MEDVAISDAVDEIADVATRAMDSMKQLVQWKEERFEEMKDNYESQINTLKIALDTARMERDEWKKRFELKKYDTITANSVRVSCLEMENHDLRNKLHHHQATNTQLKTKLAQFQKTFDKYVKDGQLHQTKLQFEINDLHSHVKKMNKVRKKKIKRYHHVTQILLLMNCKHVQVELLSLVVMQMMMI